MTDLTAHRMSVPTSNTYSPIPSRRVWKTSWPVTELHARLHPRNSLDRRRRSDRHAILPRSKQVEVHVKPRCVQSGGLLEVLRSFAVASPF